MSVEQIRRVAAGLHRLGYSMRELTRALRRFRYEATGGMPVHLHQRTLARLAANDRRHDTDRRKP